MHMLYFLFVLKHSFVLLLLKTFVIKTPYSLHCPTIALSCMCFTQGSSTAVYTVAMSLYDITEASPIKYKYFIRKCYYWNLYKVCIYTFMSTFNLSLACVVTSA